MQSQTRYQHARSNGLRLRTSHQQDHNDRRVDERTRTRSCKTQTMAARGTCHERKSNRNSGELVGPNHPPCTRGASRLREKVWWPDMDRQVETLIRSCHACQLVRPRQKPTPVNSTSCSSRGSMDTPCYGSSGVIWGDHLLVIDYFSRRPEVFFTKKTDASHVSSV